MKIAASILFDSAYVESALVTAHEVSQRTEVFDALHLVYVNRGADDDQAARSLVARFQAACSGGVAVNAIEIGNNLPAFDAYHFNNSILYKALVPSLLPGSRFILNLDAGILLGRGFDDFVAEMVARLCSADANWVIAANTLAAADNLSPAQLQRPHHPRYPTGAVLLFNARRFDAVGWSARYLAGLAQLQGQLRYAEQELICLTANADELVDLPRQNALKVCFLGDQVLTRAAPRLPDAAADDCVFFKFAGSFKPWKYWVLDPDKAIYTRRRERLESQFPISGNPVIEKQRQTCMNPQWASTFLKLYDDYLAAATV